MSVLNLYDVDFEIVKASAGGAGKATAYRRGARKATISAASGHPKDILAVLNADISVGTGETIEILGVSSGHVSGTEGGSVLS